MQMRAYMVASSTISTSWALLGGIKVHTIRALIVALACFWGACKKISGMLGLVGRCHLARWPLQTK